MNDVLSVARGANGFLVTFHVSLVAQLPQSETPEFSGMRPDVPVRVIGDRAVSMLYPDSETARLAIAHYMTTNSLPQAPPLCIAAPIDLDGIDTTPDE